MVPTPAAFLSLDATRTLMRGPRPLSYSELLHGERHLALAWAWWRPVWETNLRAAWITARDLVGAMLVSVAVGVAVNNVATFLPEPCRGPVAGLVAAVVVTIGAGWWGRHMARHAGAPEERRSGRLSGFALGPSVIVVAATLAGAEPGLVAQGAARGFPIHVVYLVLFVPSALLVAAVGGIALGIGLRDLHLGMRLATRAGPAAALAFLAIALLMDTSGWRVGGPDAARRATMLVVTALSSTSAALAAGAAIGHYLGGDGPEDAA